MTVMTVQVDIGAALKDGFTAAFGKAETTAVKLDNAISAVDTRIGTMKGWAAAKKETAAAKEEWIRAEAKAKALAGQLADTAKPTEDLKNKVAAARQEADKAKAAFVGAGTGLKAMDTQMKAAGVAIRAVKVELEAAEKSMAALERRKESLNRAMAAKAANSEARGALKDQLLGTTALAASFAAPVVQAIKFENAMADVRKAVNFDDPVAGLKQMETTIKDLAREIPIAQDGIAAIVSAGGRMDIGAADLRDYTVTVSKMSTAWEMAPDAAGEAMGKIKNIMGLAVKDLELVGDAINKLDDSSTAKATEIVDVLKRTGGAGKQFGLNTQQIAALSTAFLDLGDGPEVASTAINALLQKLQGAPVQSKKFQEALQGLGWEAREMQQAIGKDAQGTLTKFLQTVKGLEKDTRVNTLAELFGAEYSDNITKLVEGLDTYQKHLKTVGDQSNYAGSMTAEFAIRSQTTSNQLQLTANAMNRAAINIGTVLLPAVKDISGGLATATDAAATFAEAHPVLTKVVVFTTAALVGYKVAKLATGFAWTTVKGAYLDTRVAMIKTAAAANIASTSMRGFSFASATAGVRGFGASLLAFAARPVSAVLMGLRAVKVAVMTNPIGLIATGLITVAQIVIENWDKIWKVVKPAVEWIGRAMDAIPVVGTAIQTVKGMFGGADAEDAADKAVEGAANDNPANDNIPALPEVGALPKAAGGRGNVYNQTFNFVINAAPGQSSEAIAGSVKRSFENKTGGALYDDK